MRIMDEQQIARLEARLEQLVEGTFANLFGRRIRAQDIALQLARAMEDNTKTPDNDPRPLAPDQYIIYVNPEVQVRLAQNQPGLVQILSEHIIELASLTGYRLNNAPLIEIVADDRLDTGKLSVKAYHTDRLENSTAVMERVVVSTSHETPRNPQLLIDGQQTIPLKKGIVNVGRYRDNDIILDDRFVSRRHVQLRLRFGAYTLFDIQSHSGTFVNDVKVKEHRLQPGDVIRIGKSRLVYIEDNPLDDSRAQPTEVFIPPNQDDTP